MGCNTWPFTCCETLSGTRSGPKSADHLNLDSVNAGYTPLHWAAKNGHTQTVKLLIEKNVQLNMQSANSAHTQAIHVASCNGHLDIVKLLLEKQPTLLNQTDHCRQTPILWAAAHSHTHLVKYLAEQGADLNLGSGNNAANNSEGYTPLHWACKEGYTKTIKVLLEKNANIEARDIQNQLPTDVAMRNSLYRHELDLLVYSAKVNRRNDDDYYYKFKIFGHESIGVFLVHVPQNKKKKLYGQ